MLGEALEREAKGVALMQVEREQWQSDRDYLHNENKLREAALVEHRQMLGEALEREAKGEVRLRAERARSELALAEHRRLQEKVAEREISLVGEIEGLRVNMAALRTQSERLAQSLSERDQQLAAMEVELFKSREELSKTSVLEVELAQKNKQISLNFSEIEDLRQVEAGLVEALETRSREFSSMSCEASAFQQKSINMVGDLELIFASRSWRLTRPLRRIIGVWNSWRRDGNSRAVSDVESKYRLLAPEVFSVSDPRPGLDDTGVENSPNVEAILIEKNVEAITGLRNRIRRLNNLKNN